MTSRLTLKRIQRFLFGNTDFGVARGDVVLELGSGHNPWYRSDILLDKYVGDATEREGALYINRPFVVGDACRLPFADKSVDFIVCRHLLEHMPDPKGFLAELSRVGKAGYIETPSEFFEQLFGWEFHRWAVCENEGGLVLKAKEKKILNPYFHERMHKIHAENGKWYRFWESRIDLFLVMHRWKGSVSCRVEGTLDENLFQSSESDEDPILALMNLAKPSLKQKLLQRGLSLLKILLHGRRKVDIWSLLACPSCNAPCLVRLKNGLECSGCLRTYPVVNGIPVLLTD